MKYRTDWRDSLRHVCNLFAVAAYICFEHGHVLAAAVCTLLAEVLLTPSAIKHRSWSTMMSSMLFLGLALGTISRSLFS